MSDVKEVCALGSRFLAQVHLYVDIRLITSPCTAQAMCAWQDFNYKPYFNWTLINYLCTIKEKRETKRPGIFCEKGLKNILTGSKTTITVPGWMKKRSGVLGFMFSTFPSIQNNIQNIKYFCIIIFSINKLCKYSDLSANPRKSFNFNPNDRFTQNIFNVSVVILHTETTKTFTF